MIAGEYAPIALGASGALITSLTLRCLRDLAVAEASRADAHPFGRPIYEGANSLQIGFKPTGADVVCVGYRSPNDGTLLAHFTPLCHVPVSLKHRSNSPPGMSIEFHPAPCSARYANPVL